MVLFARILLASGLIGCLLPCLAVAQTIVPIGNGFNAPERVAVDGSGNVFVADTGNHVVREILAEGGYVASRTFGNGMVLPQGVAVDSQGNIFVADPTAKAVKEIVASGGYTNVQPVGSGYNMPTGVAIDSNDNVFVVDAGSLDEVLAAGGYTTVKQIALGVYNGGSGIAIDSSNNLYIASSTDVEEILAASGYQTAETLGYGFNSPYGVAVDASGNVYVADTGNNAVKEIPATGGLIPTVKTLGSGFQSPTGISVDSNGNVFVTDQGNNAVKEITASSGYVTVETLGSGFTRPVGVALGPNGNLFVSDTGADAIKELEAVGGYATVDTLSYGLSGPTGVAVDGQDNIFIADGVVKEILAAGDYATMNTLGSGFSEPSAVAVDGAGNVFVADTGNEAVKEILAAGGYTTVTTLINASNSEVAVPNGVAVDSSGDVFVAFGANGFFGHEPVINAVEEILAVNGSIPAAPTIVTLGSGFILPFGVAVDSSGNVYVADAESGDIDEILAAGGYVTVNTLARGFNGPDGVAVAGNGAIFVADTGNNAVKEIFFTPPTPLLAAVLPDSRSVQIGSTATIFASMINSGTGALDNCRIALAASAPAGLTLGYQTTDPTTNSLTGTPNTPVAIPGNDGLQTFLIAFQGTAAFNAPSMPLEFACDGVAPATNIPGVDTVDLAMSDTPVADIIVLAATLSNDGVVDVPDRGVAAFAVATSNLGATATIIVTVDTGTADLPLFATICQSDPSNGACLGTANNSVTLSDAGGATPTFSIFLQSNGPIPFAPASSRVFVRFKDGDGNLHGSTSVAIKTF
jgi:sugar lactone lactonase YvrE